MVLWNMHGGGVNKLETRVQILELFQGADLILLTEIWHFPGQHLLNVQILELFQGADLVLLTETWHFPGQHLPNVEGFDSLGVRRTVQLGKTKMIKHNRGLLLTFAATSI